MRDRFKNYSKDRGKDQNNGEKFRDLKKLQVHIYKDRHNGENHDPISKIITPEERRQDRIEEYPSDDDIDQNIGIQRKKNYDRRKGSAFFADIFPAISDQPQIFLRPERHFGIHEINNNRNKPQNQEKNGSWNKSGYPRRIRQAKNTRSNSRADKRRYGIDIIFIEHSNYLFEKNIFVSLA